MKPNLNDGSQGEGFTPKEYYRAIGNVQIPNFTGFLDANLAGFDEFYKPQDVKRYYVECRQNWITKEETWILRFDQGETQIHFSCVAGTRIDHRGITRLEVTKGIEVNAYTDVDRRQYVFDANASSFQDFAQERDGKLIDKDNNISFSLAKKMYLCTHAESGKVQVINSCSHIRQYIRDHRDARVLNTFVVSGENMLTITVPVFDGLAMVPVTISKHVEDDVLGNGSSKILFKYMINDDFTAWPDMNAPSMNILLEQFEGAMQNSVAYADWVLQLSLLVEARKIGREASSVKLPCPNKHHGATDNFALWQECTSIGGDGVSESGIEAIALENAVRTEVSGCCTSCYSVRQSMRNDYVKQSGRDFRV